jgi:uncharacterized RDD family membrane protein YckC
MNQDNLYQPPKSQVADIGPDDETELAPRGARFGAAIIDGLILALVLVPVTFATGYWESIVNGESPSMAVEMGYAALGFIAYAAFHGYLLQKYGQTIGKRLTGMRIVSVGDNRILPLSRLLGLRQLPISVASQIPVVGPFVGFVDCLFVFRSDRRCIHDLIAGTKVVKATVPWKTPDA